MGDEIIIFSMSFFFYFIPAYLFITIIRYEYTPAGKISEKCKRVCESNCGELN